MTARDQLLETMRADLRTIGPKLKAAGWTDSDIAEISSLVRAHVAANDDQALQAMAKWLSSRAHPAPSEADYQQLEAARERWQAANSRQVAVSHCEADIREANKEWVRQRVMGGTGTETERGRR